MKQVQKILFPIDLSEKFEGLLPWVSTFVNAFDAELHVVFVTEDLKSISFIPHVSLGQLQQEALKAAEQKMAAAKQEFFKNFKKLVTRVEIGKAADKILEVAKKEGVDLIIMGTHGRRGLEAKIFGSVCMRVVRDAEVPVLTIHPPRA
ncbi:MAG: universal stress protein [Deltaproteobacteria bacterium]|nr:universal stress protein [Deltaproteobacteria bacterium]